MPAFGNPGNGLPRTLSNARLIAPLFNDKRQELISDDLLKRGDIT
jgi:hypothetical protein